MPPYRRDPLSEWFDGVAADWLERAYRHPNTWAVTYLAPPSRTRRAQAAAELGEYDLDARDRYGERRWTRAYKRSVYWNHKTYGYAAELRPGDRRADDGAATGLRWKTRGLIFKSGWPARRLELAIMIVSSDAAMSAAARRPASKRWDLNEAYRSKPGAPDRPWDG